MANTPLVIFPKPGPENDALIRSYEYSPYGYHHDGSPVMVQGEPFEDEPTLADPATRAKEERGGQRLSGLVAIILALLTLTGACGVLYLAYRAGQQRTVVCHHVEWVSPPDGPFFPMSAMCGDTRVVVD